MKLSFLAIIVAAIAVTASAAERGKLSGVSFRVTAATEVGGARNVIADAVVQGPPGTDFTIALNAGRFHMDARFLTEMIAPGALIMRASLETKRLYGQSERGLPLYEEDRQAHTFTVGFNEQLVLLPFGGRDQTERLVIDIIPSRIELTTTDLQIRFTQTTGELTIDAFRIPHRFIADVEIVRDGSIVARGSGAVSIQEPTAVPLRAVAGEASVFGSLTLVLSVDSFQRSRQDFVRLSFDLLRGGRPLLRNWAGASALTERLRYDVTKVFGQNKPVELRMSIRTIDSE